MKEIESFLMPPNFCEALIFDLDGTLADTMPVHLRSWRMIGEQYGYPIVDEMITDRTGTPTIPLAEQFNKEYGWQLDPMQVYHDKNKIYAELQSTQRPIQAIPEILAVARFFKNDKLLAIGTGSTRGDAEMALRDMQIEDWFPIMITADEIEQGKPHPETYLKCAEGLGVAPETCMVYEDGPMGIKAAIDAGMSAINIVTKERYIL